MNQTPYNYLSEAIIYNKRNEKVPWDWMMENVDIVALLFTANGVDKDGVMLNFHNIYESLKHVNLPIEVIYVPMDETEEESKACYEGQANWFALRFHDPLVHIIKYMYEITCIPHLLVLKIDGTVISSHGILDLEEYGKNAIITWLSTSASTKKHRRMSKDATMYGLKWKYNDKNGKHEYQRKFTTLDEISH